jgi:hypothetical protein
MTVEDEAKAARANPSTLTVGGERGLTLVLRPPAATSIHGGTGWRYPPESEREREAR